MTESAFGNAAWVSAFLGCSEDWFYRNQGKLYADGFPERDPVMKMFLKSDVGAWVESRKKFSDAVIQKATDSEINIDAL